MSDSEHDAQLIANIGLPRKGRIRVKSAVSGPFHSSQFGFPENPAQVLPDWLFMRFAKGLITFRQRDWRRKQDMMNLYHAVSAGQVSLEDIA